MHHYAMLWLKGRNLLSWLAFGTSASAATSRSSFSSRPVYIRYLNAAPAAALNHPLLYHNAAVAALLKAALSYHSLEYAADAAVLHYYPLCHYAAAVVQYSLLLHLCL